MAFSERNVPLPRCFPLSLLLLTILLSNQAFGIRLPDQISSTTSDATDQSLKLAVFALGSFWRSKAVFGCLDSIVQTTVGYSGRSKPNPEDFPPRSIILANGTEESRVASTSKEKEQLKSRSSIVTTQIQQLVVFYPAEPEHQKFELKRKPSLLQLMGNLFEEELERSSLAAKLNGYAIELCPPKIQGQIDAKINEIVKKGWPVLRNI